MNKLTLLSTFIGLISTMSEMNYAPSFPFHFAVPVHNLELAKNFYGGLLGFEEGRSSDRW